MMRMVALLVLGVTNCAAQTLAPPSAQTAPIVDDDGRCDATAAARLIGRTADAAAGKEALRLSGAAVLRWIRPRDDVTADYLTNRLNILVNERGRIRELRCG